MAYKVDSAFYIGRDDERHITEFFVSDNLYLILELKNGHNRHEVSEIFRNFKNEIIFKTDISLEELKGIVSNAFDSISNKENYSLAIILLINDISYLLTRGDGEIYLYRHGKYNKIVYGDLEASGYCAVDDMFMLSSKSFSNIIDSNILENTLILKDPKTIIGELTPELKEKEDTGAISLLIYLKEVVEEEIFLDSGVSDSRGIQSEKQIVISDGIFDRLKYKFDYYQKNFSHNKKITFLLISIIAAMFIWSVGFGSSRRAEAQLASDIKTYQQKIDTKLSEANDIGVLNPDKAMVLLTDAKNIFSELKNIVGDKKPDEIKLILASIDNAEKSILKKEDKNYQVFFDWNLIKKDIKIVGPSVDGDFAVFINKSLGEAYYLSLSKKSVNTIKKEEIKKAAYFSSYNSNLFIYSAEDGIYKIDNDGKVALIVKKDTEWGLIGGMIVFNGNIYLLDKGKDSIYKYLVAENGYSDKNIYFKPGQEVKLSDFVNFSIDANIYILTNSGIFKYLSGVRDDFSYNLPDSSGNYQKIYADKNNEKVYVLEKEKGRMYVLSNKGQYEKQIGSSIFSKAQDVFINEDMKSIFIFVSDKIYQVAL